MRATLELILSHDGNDWITDSLNKQLHGKDLHHLEDIISMHIKIDQRFINNETIDVTLLFDMDHFPRWLTQYQSHYFNYSFTVNNQEQLKP